MMIRKFVTGQETALDRIVEKRSQGVVEDIRTGDIIRPAVIKCKNEDAWSLFRGNEWLFSVITRITRDVVKCVPNIVPKDKSKKISSRMQRRIDMIKKFFSNPNDNKESFRDIRYKTVIDMLVYGYASIEKVLDVNGSRRLLEIYSQSAKYLKVNADDHGNLAVRDTYFIDNPKSQNKQTKFDIDELIMLVLHPVSGSSYGIKPLDSIVNSVATDILRSSFNANFFVNGAEASGVLSLQEMLKGDLKKFKEEWKNKFQGVKNAHRLAIVNVPANFIRMAMTNRDMQFGEYGVELMHKIFAAYGMQPIIMGVVDKSTGRLNSQQQIENYKDGAIRPILSCEAQYYTSEIIEMGFGFDDLVLEFSSVDLADIQTQSDIDRKDIESGVMVINEIRNRRGLGTVPWGDTPVSLAPGGGQVDPNTGRIVSPSNQEGKPDPKKPVPKKNIFSRFEKTCLFRTELMLEKLSSDNTIAEQLAEIKIDNLFKTKNIYINSKKFDLQYPTLPFELKNKQIMKFVYETYNLKFDLDDDDVRRIYLDYICSKLRFIVFDNLKNKNISNINIEINKLFYDERNSKPYRELF